MNNTEIAQVYERYGKYSAAALLLKKAHLLEEMKEGPGGRESASRWYSQLVDHYSRISAALAPSPHLSYVGLRRASNTEILTYDAREYSRRLLRDRAALDSCRVRLDDSAIREGAIHIYAVDTTGEVWISRQPLSITELFARAEPNALSHADLVEHRGLEALAAGELIGARVGGVVKGLVLNNRSGHFLPRARHLRVACERIGDMLGIDRRDVYPLSVARDD